MESKGFKKILLLIPVAIVVLALLIILALWANLDTIARIGIEKVLSSVLQVEVSLKKADVSVTKGSVELQGLVIGNPEGFKTREAFSADSIYVKADIKSFRTEEPVVQLIEVRAPRITLERGFKTSNLGQLIENASGSEAEEEEAPKEAGKKLRIEKVVVDEGHVGVSAPVLQGREVGFPLPRIEMDDIGGEKKERVSVAEALRVFFGRILSESLAAGKGVIPADLKKALDDSLKSALEMSRGAGETLRREGGKLGERLEEGTGAAKEGVEGLRKGIKGILKKE